MSVKFVIVSAPRTGSTLLRMTMHSIEGVHCHGELLNNRVLGFEDGFDILNATQQERQERAQRLLRKRAEDPVTFIREALAMGQNAGGFKVLYEVFKSSVWQPVIEELMNSTPLRFIHLVRINELRRYVSEQVLRVGGPIHSGPGGRGVNKRQVSIDIENFERASAAMSADVQAIRDLLTGREVLEITYEELSSHTGQTVALVGEFLDLSIDATQVEPALKKVGSADLGDTVINFDELLEHPVTREFART